MDSELIERTAPRGLMVFLVIWSGQFFSIIGSSLSAFALGLWVYQVTGSTTKFALISLCSALPAIVVSPFAGAIVDRWNKRSAMILSDTGSALTILAVALLLFAGTIEVWQVYVAVALISIFTAFQLPAYSAWVTVLVPRQHLGRVGGMMQMGDAVAQIIAPALGGMLVFAIDVKGVLIIDVATFLMALAALVIVRIPKLVVDSQSEVAKCSLLRDASYGWKYIQSRPGLLGLMIFFAVGNFMVGVISVLVTPLILTLGSTAALGTVMSVGGIGMLLGSVVMSLWGGPKRPLRGVFGSSLVCGLCSILVGLSVSIPVIAMAAFFFFFGESIIYGSSQAIWQIKVSPEVQGRVFAVRSMIGWTSLSFAYLIAGPLADHIFEPALAIGGPLANSIGLIVGTGPGRGVSLIFIVMGLLNVVLVIWGCSHKPLRAINTEVSLMDTGEAEGKALGGARSMHPGG